MRLSPPRLHDRLEDKHHLPVADRGAHALQDVAVAQVERAVENGTGPARAAGEGSDLLALMLPFPNIPVPADRLHALSPTLSPAIDLCPWALSVCAQEV
ncbi:hypothetical protein [Alloyangia mangrovi]|uniref:hypothetical protein n=1 Tax=Alloyangia mangrovi TaxID=1779329 RepID=UPI0035D469D9